MIDTHCHLEQVDYDKDRDLVIQRCKEHLQAVITSCASPKRFDLTTQLVKRYRGFVFATASIHPIYAQDLNEKEIEAYIDRIKRDKKEIVAIGETGLDFNWTRKKKMQERQKNLFSKFIHTANDLNLPLVIHSRDATHEVLRILEQNNAKQVQMHMFTEHPLLNLVIEMGWCISVNTLLLRSKRVRKIVRDCPLNHLMLETDAPWLGIDEDGNIKAKEEVRNEPTTVIRVAKRVAEIKKVDLKEVDEQTTKNAIHLFNLKI